MEIKNEFQINDFITLKLEWNKKKCKYATEIYVLGRKFLQCKHLFLIIPNEDPKKKWIDSIDDLEKLYGSGLEEAHYKNIRPEDFGLTAKEVFWGHCSNIQVWAENNYDTRLLHSNLSFPMLRKLVEVGDLKARAMYRKEVAIRYSTGCKKLRQFLYDECYMSTFNNEEIAKIGLKSEQYLALKQLSKETNIPFDHIFSPIHAHHRNVSHLHLIDTEVFPESLLNLRDELKQLRINLKGEKKIPNWIGELKKVERLSITGNFKLLPESIGMLKSLKELSIQADLMSLPDSIGDLVEIEKLYLNENNLTFLPDSIKNLKKLRNLNLSGNNFKKVPGPIFYLKKLETINLKRNPMQNIPKWLKRLPLVYTI